MDRFAIIGLGRFGSRLASNLTAAGREVIAVDRDIALVDEIKDRVTMAIAFDATDEQALRSHGIDQVDVAVVGIGDDFESTALTTVTLKQIGVPRVVSRAMTRTAARILTRIGADEVVNPEDESADRWCGRLVNPSFLSHHTFSPGFSVVEVRTPEAWVGKTLKELNVRVNTGVLVIAVKSESGDGAASDRQVMLLSPDRPLASQEILVLAGADDNLHKISGG